MYTVSLKEASGFGATRAGQYLASWAYGQGDLWVGLGDTEIAALEDAEREMDEQGIDPDGLGTVTAYLVVE